MPWSSGLRRLTGDAKVGGSISGTALMPFRKAFLSIHCSFIVYQVNESAICIIDTNVCTCLKTNLRFEVIGLHKVFVHRTKLGFRL